MNSFKKNSSAVTEERKTAQVEVVETNPQFQQNKNSAWTTVKKLCKRWFIDAFTGMAQGLFVTLIAGTILKTIGELIGNNPVGNLFILIGKLAAILMGAGIGAGIASHLKMPKLVVFTAIVAGFVGAFSEQFIGQNFSGGNMGAIATILGKGLPGNPIGAYVTALLSCEIANLVAGKTKLDILLVPLTGLLVAMVGAYVSFPFIWLINQLGRGIAWATSITPFFMGVIISAVMGILLTMPTSSAAIWVAVASPILNSATSTAGDINAILIAGGAAVVGCACQMVGFAVMSFKENGWGGLISQGVGTSMLQIPNIMKNPRIFIPPIVASIICGPIATVGFKLKCGASGGGMGTCGFVGVIDSFNQSVTNGGMSWWLFAIAVILLFFVLPAVISWAVGLLLRKVGWIKENDLLLAV
ncbi:MAG: PTS sugar transporter subunit IIC [Clostridia bacterium]